MGYQTNYKLTWAGDVAKTKPCSHCDGTGKIAVEDIVQEFVDTEPFLYSNTQPIADSLEDSCKWYDHEEDMRRLSLKFPDVVFTLNGEGEEAGDVWVKYFRNGKMQVDKIEIKLAAFDPKKLA